VKLLSGATTEISTPGSTIFEKEGLDAMASVPMMEERIKTHIDEHQRDGHNAIRISTHVYNTKAEIDRLLEALAKA
jgi:selenocysteine lyase/cysteine desulfurase